MIGCRGKFAETVAQQTLAQQLAVVRMPWTALGLRKRAGSRRGRPWRLVHAFVAFALLSPRPLLASAPL